MRHPNFFVGRHLKELIQLDTLALENLPIKVELFHLQGIDLRRLMAMVRYGPPKLSTSVAFAKAQVPRLQTS